MRRLTEKHRSMAIAIGGWAGLGLIAMSFVIVAILMATSASGSSTVSAVHAPDGTPRPTQRQKLAVVVPGETPLGAPPEAEPLDHLPTCSVPVSTCWPGCEQTCRRNERAKCWCQKTRRLCDGPYYGGMDCYDYSPRCICE